MCCLQLGITENTVSQWAAWIREALSVYNRYHLVQLGGVDVKVHVDEVGSSRLFLRIQIRLFSVRQSICQVVTTMSWRSQCLLSRCSLARNENTIAVTDTEDCMGRTAKKSWFWL